VFAGQYTVTEDADPTGFVFESLNCTNSTGNSTTTSGKTATINVVGDGSTTCTYVNQQQLGAIKITKTSSKTAATPLSGAKFAVSSGGNPISGSPFTTGATGTVCVDHLPFGTYSVQETQAPSGYQIDDNTAHDVTVNRNSTCGDGNEATFSATDTPLTDVKVHANSEAAGGTQSRITCTNAGGTVTWDSGASNTDPADANKTGLVPGDYTCTIHIDP
jgi:uncharacterized surface anchored protein